MSAHTRAAAPRERIDERFERLGAATTRLMIARIPTTAISSISVTAGRRVEIRRIGALNCPTGSKTVFADDVGVGPDLSIRRVVLPAACGAGDGTPGHAGPI